MAEVEEDARPAGHVDDEEEPDQTQMMHHNVQWMRVQPVTKATALDYFAASVFYDRSCDNEQCFMQRQSRGNTELLLRMTGIQYAVVAAHEPSLFIIKKVKRVSPSETIDRALYYIMDGATFQAPSVAAVARARMMNSLHLLQQSLSTLSKIRNMEDEPAEVTAQKIAGKAKYVVEQRQEWAPSPSDFRSAYSYLARKFPTAPVVLPDQAGQARAAAEAAGLGQKRTIDEVDGTVATQEPVAVKAE